MRIPIFRRTHARIEADTRLIGRLICDNLDCENAPYWWNLETKKINKYFSDKEIFRYIRSKREYEKEEIVCITRTKGPRR